MCEGGGGRERGDMMEWGGEKATTVCGVFSARFWGNSSLHISLLFPIDVVDIIVVVGFVALETLSICIICVYYMFT